MFCVQLGLSQCFLVGTLPTLHLHDWWFLYSWLFAMPLIVISYNPLVGWLWPATITASWLSTSLSVLTITTSITPVKSFSHSHQTFWPLWKLPDLPSNPLMWQENGKPRSTFKEEDCRTATLSVSGAWQFLPLPYKGPMRTEVPCWYKPLSARLS